MCFHAEKFLKHSNFENRQIRYIILAPDLRNHPKYPKNGSLNRDLLKFLHRYDIYCQTYSKSSCPELFRICVAKGGIESLRPNYRQPKLTLISSIAEMEIFLLSQF